MGRSVAGLGSLAAVALAVGLTPAGEKRAKEIDNFFASGETPHLVIEFAKPELDAVRREPRKYAKATLKDGTYTYENVGVHLRGAIGSYQGFDAKPGLTLNMDKFVDDQSFHGMDKFHLANSVQDGSYLSELICGEMYRAAGVPAARVAHATVTLQGKPRGFYYLKEGYDREFLERHFKNSHGNLYDGGFLHDIDKPLKLLSGRRDVRDRKDLKALVAAAKEPDRAKRFEQLDRLLDMDRFLSFVVVSVIAADWDGYAMKPNNYRVYHDPDRDKIVFIPSGMDQMFGDTGWNLTPGFNGLVARAVIDTPEGKKRYVAKFREVVAKVFDPDRWVKRLDELEAKVKPELAKVDPGAANGYKGQVDRLRNAIKARRKNLDEQLAKLKD